MAKKKVKPDPAEIATDGEPDDCEVSLDALFGIKMAIEKIDNKDTRESCEKEFRAVKVAFDLSRGPDKKRAAFWRGEAAKRLLALRFRLGV